MRSLFSEAWHRFGIISRIVSDTNARIVAVLFYFTFLVPFGLIYTLFGDPLNRKPGPVIWLKREDIPNDLDTAKRQG